MRPSVGHLTGDLGAPFARHSGPAVHISQVLGGLRALGHSVRAVDAGSATGGSEATRHLLARRAQDHQVDGWILGRWAALYDAGLEELASVDVLYERHCWASLPGLLLSERLDKPLVVELNAPPVEEARAFYPHVLELVPAELIESLLERYLERAARVRVVSSTLARILKSKYPAVGSKIRVLPNGAEAYPPPPPEAALAIRRQLGLEGHEVVMIVGHAQPWHGIELLLTAFRAVVASRPRARLVVIGEGPATDRLTGAGAEHVHWVGAVAPEAIRDYLAAADVLVAPYQDVEPAFYFSPLKIFEYMAAGRAIIASALGQVEELLEHGRSGWLIPASSADALRGALERLLGDPAARDRLGAGARRAAELHTWSETAQGVARACEEAGALATGERER